MWQGLKAPKPAHSSIGTCIFRASRRGNRIGKQFFAAIARASRARDGRMGDKGYAGAKPPRFLSAPMQEVFKPP
jgi:hypothetical protein